MADLLHLIRLSRYSFGIECSSESRAFKYHHPQEKVNEIP